MFKVGERQAAMETAGARNDLRPSAMRKKTSKQAWRHEVKTKPISTLNLKLGRKFPECGIRKLCAVPLDIAQLCTVSVPLNVPPAIQDGCVG